MVAATALMGFFGHNRRGFQSGGVALPLAAAAVVGGLIGGGFSLKIKPHNLKRVFAYTTLAAAVFMALNALLSLSG